MMQIDIHYSLGDGPFIIGGEIDNIPFELKYLHGEACLVVLTRDFVLRTLCMYSPMYGKLDNVLAGQLIFNLARQLEEEL